MPSDNSSRAAFLALWASVVLLKLALIGQVPLFVDEAFYWQEGQHLAWAYSDLPGMSAWLARLGTEVFGQRTWGLRLPFLAIAMALPWGIVRITQREFGTDAGWRAGIYALLLPLAGSLGILALPDVVMAFATVLCMGAGARLLRGVTGVACVQLALGLALGALTHYRFAAVIAVGLLALLQLPEGRRALRDMRVWLAIGAGAAAWAPLIAWNLANADAGLRFQLVERHPWAWHWDGAWFIAIQLLLVTPLLFAALALAAWRGWRAPSAAARYFAVLGGVTVLGFFALGFVADNERVSFHWPLAGYVALLPLLPQVMDAWPRWLRRLTAGAAGLGLLAVFGYYAAVASPQWRAASAATRWYPANFAGWDELAQAVRQHRAQMPAATRIIAGSFKLGAELGFALDDPAIAVLPHPLNDKHGRSPQLRLWHLLEDAPRQGPHPPLLVVIATTDVPYKEQLRHYHELCQSLGPLPPPRIVNVDHGRQRFALFALPASSGLPYSASANTGCIAPAMAWIDTPASGEQVTRRVTASGWAFKEGVGIARVEVLLDGRSVGQAVYGLPSPGTAVYWRNSSDPQHPDVGFEATIELPATLPSGRHWLGLRLHGRDGSMEDWSEQPILLR